MTDVTQPDPGYASQDTIAEEVDHDTLAGKIWEATERASAVARRDDYADVCISSLLRSMRETHGSMRAIYTAAEKIEKAKERPTGRWADMLVLARAQFDGVFVGLLLAHDPPKWGPQYYKACWAIEAQVHFYGMRRYRKTPSGSSIRNTNIYKLKLRARQCQVTAREWIATLADIRGASFRFGATTQDRIRPLPTPGQVVRQDLLAGGLYADLAPL